MPVSVSLLDPASDDVAETVRGWHHVYTEAVRFGRPATANPWSYDEMLAALRNGRLDLERAAYVATDDAGDVVGAGLLTTTLLDNLTTADVDVLVLPERRREGIGTALLRVLEKRAAALGRTTITAAAHQGPGPAGEDLGGAAFAQAQGYALSLVDLQSRVPLPVEVALLDELAAEAAPHHAAYELRTFTGPVPDDLVEQYAALDAIVDVEAPSGDLDPEPQNADVATWRSKEEASARQGRRSASTVALDADGRVVALTEIWATGEEPTDLKQWSTIVRREHRGHRLGLAVKVANLRVAQATWPTARHVVTINADDNAPMIAVNERLGFRVVETSLELRKKV